MLTDWSWILLDLIVEDIGRQASEGVFVEATVLGSPPVFWKFCEADVRDVLEAASRPHSAFKASSCRLSESS